MSHLFDALLFPQERQERGPDPGPFPEHRSYKPHLQKVFRAKCIYCRVADGLKGYEAFGVDHYLPRSRFPHLRVAWANLFYACNLCNTRKGEFVSTPELFLPNPCEHRMADHLQYRGADIEAYTPHGEWLVELLGLAERERRETRQLVFSALGKFLKARSELLGDLTAYEAEREEARNAEKLGLLQAVIRETTEELERLERLIERLTGEPLGASPSTNP